MRTGSKGVARALLPLLICALLCAPAAWGQGKKKAKEQTRSVQGVVTTDNDTPVVGAIVYLKNTKSLDERSYITKDGGTYLFNGLSPDINYELRATYQGVSSGTKTLSSFDSRKQAQLNFKLNKKK